VECNLGVLFSAVMHSSVMWPSGEDISVCPSNVVYVVLFFVFGLENTRGSTPANRTPISLPLTDALDCEREVISPDGLVEAELCGVMFFMASSLFTQGT
jgi:hypothetical protein